MAPPPLSRVNSSRNPSPSASSLPQHLTAMETPKNDSDNISGWFRNLVEKPKYAVFEVKVNIDELGNVPQLTGRFEAGWKFKGKAAHKHEINENAVAGPSNYKTLSPKPSLPNIKLSQTPTLHSASSTTSLSSRTSTTSTPVQILPTSLQISSPTSLTGSRAPSINRTTHSNTSPLAGNSSIREDGSPSVSPSKNGKKASEPTPLRQSMRPDKSEDELNSAEFDKEVFGQKLQRVDSPAKIDNSLPGSRKGSDESMKEGNTKGGGKFGSASSSLVGNNKPGSIDSYRSSPLQSASSSTYPKRSSTSSNNSAVLGGVGGGSSRSGTSTPHHVARSGTLSSHTTLLDPVPGRDDLPLMPPKIIRSNTGISVASTSASILDSSDTTPSPVDYKKNFFAEGFRSATHLAKDRVKSGGKSKSSDTSSIQHSHSSHSNHHIQSHQHSSTNRKGVTPAKDLRQHTCEWAYTVTQTIRIPIGKPVMATGSNPSSSSGVAGSLNVPGAKRSVPILGGGPDSDSGFKLNIYEIKSSGSMSSKEPAGMNKNNVLSVIHGVHVVNNHPDKNASEGGHLLNNVESVDKLKKEKEKHEKIMYGFVDIDLAPFAGKGKIGRRFLLKGSRTNATLRITVEMKQVGGEVNWAAPPLIEGHHVAGIRDLVGENAGTSHPDIGLSRRSSGDSSSSSLNSGSPLPSRSASSVNLALGNHSAVSLHKAQPPPAPSYKTFEHHLKPPTSSSSHGDHSHSKKKKGGTTKIDTSSLSPGSSTAGGAAGGVSPITPPESPSAIYASIPLTPLESPTTPHAKTHGQREDDGFFNFSRRKTVHHHHSFHLRHSSSSHHHHHRGALHPDSPENPNLNLSTIDSDNDSNQSQSNGQGGHRRSKPRHGHGHSKHHHHHGGVSEMQAEQIIELVFNPRPAAEEGPMTYVPNEEFGKVTGYINGGFTGFSTHQPGRNGVGGGNGGGGGGGLKLDIHGDEVDEERNNRRNGTDDYSYDVNEGGEMMGRGSLEGVAPDEWEAGVLVQKPSKGGRMWGRKKAKPK